jgi:hypothetical protein
MNVYTYEGKTHRIVPKRSKQKHGSRIRVICLNGTGSLWQIDERLSLSDIERNCPKFFSCTHGKRETYTIYRGQLIVRNTVQFTGMPKKRKTTVYLVVTHQVSRGNWHRKGNFDTFCLGSDFSGIESAKRAIDRVLEEGHDKAV